MKRTFAETTMADALCEIDALPALNRKQRNCLRLLTEEMFSMIRELLGEERLGFEVEHEAWLYSLRVSVKTRVGPGARQEFLSMSADGRNEANRGVRGVLGAVIEAFAYAGESGRSDDGWMYSLVTGGRNYVQSWSLSHYMKAAPAEAADVAWDGMEKSIIANFADDVLIGVRGNRLDMTVMANLA